MSGVVSLVILFVFGIVGLILAERERRKRKPKRRRGILEMSMWCPDDHSRTFTTKALVEEVEDLGLYSKIKILDLGGSPDWAWNLEQLIGNIVSKQYIKWIE